MRIACVVVVNPDGKHFPPGSNPRGCSILYNAGRGAVAVTIQFRQADQFMMMVGGFMPTKHEIGQVFLFYTSILHFSEFLSENHARL